MNRLPEMISVDGDDGTNPENRSMESIRSRVHAEMDQRYPDGWTERYEQEDRVIRRAAVELFQYYLHLPFALSLHNKAVPAATLYAQASADVERAMVDAEEMYADLSKNTTINWLAAHHRYMLSVVRVRDLLTARVDAAAALAGNELADLTGLTRMIYEEKVPAEKRLTIPDIDEARIALTKFVEETRARIDILRATISAGYPEGFEPAPQVPRQAGPVEDDWSADQPASVAVVASERGW